MRRIGQHWALIAAAILDLAYIPFTLSHLVPPEDHGLVGFELVILSFAAISWHFRGTQLKPGQVVVSTEDFQRAEQIQKESIARGHGEACIFQERRNERDAAGRLGA